ncbi:MAG: CHASE domain-containing protein, partial [Verrucomicrobiota bacterium]
MDSTELLPHNLSERVFHRSAWIVLATALAVTAAATVFTAANVKEIEKNKFLADCHSVCQTIKDRLDDHARILRAGGALFAASAAVTREEWHAFNEAQKIEKSLPGIQGIGYSVLIPGEDLARHTREIRAEGFPEYEVKPAGDRALYSSIIFLEPFSGRNLRAFGFDMFQEPIRRAAMERARDTGSPALSGPVVLVQETGEHVQVGSLMYVPVYRNGLPPESIEQRRAAILGWVYSPYRMDDLMQGILSGSPLDKNQQLHMKIFDGTLPSPENLLYDWHSAAGSGYRFSRQFPMTFQGRQWTLAFTQTGSIGTENARIVWLVLAGGSTIALLLFFMLRALLNKAARELLRVASSRMKVATRAGSVGIWDFDTGTGSLHWDSEMFKLYGMPEAGSSPVYATWLAALHPEDLQRMDDEIRRALSGEKDFDTEFRVAWPDGQIRHLRGLAEVERDPLGHPLRMVGTNWDITPEKQAGEKLQDLHLRLEATTARANELAREATLANAAKSEFLANMSH